MFGLRATKGMGIDKNRFFWRFKINYSSNQEYVLDKAPKVEEVHK